MRQAIYGLALLAALGLMALVTAGRPGLPAQAQSGGGYDLTWNTFDAGGLMFAAGGSYTLGSTAGQADAGGHSGGMYDLSGGFWQASEQVFVFVPIVRR